jgi:hypothetical protein
MNFLDQLRQAARNTTDASRTKTLTEIADQLDTALLALLADPKSDNLARVNGLWVFAVRLLAQPDPTWRFVNE